MRKNSRIPLWVNIFLGVLLLIMAMQVYWFLFNHQFLEDAGITIQGVPDLNIIYTTAGRLVAMIAVSIFVLITQNPNQYLVVLLLSIFREGQRPSSTQCFPIRMPVLPQLILGCTSSSLPWRYGHLSWFTKERRT